MRKLKFPRPLRHFYLYPDGRWVHFRVFIWKTQHDMFLALPDRGTDFEAISCGGERYVEVKKRWQFCGELGQLHFYHDSARMGIITHECCHSAHAYFRFRRWFDPFTVKKGAYNVGRKWVTDREEVFCWVMGNLVREFVYRWQKMRGGKPKVAPNWFNPVKFRVHSKPLNWNGR